jgi:hypothetical protein
MKAKQIEKIRKKYPVTFDELTRYSSFEQILGRHIDDFPSEEKKRRWNKIMSLDNRMKNLWMDCTGCEGCIYLSEYWCKIQDLPCSVNPVLSFQYGQIGMACCGIGKILVEPELFEEPLF